MIPELAYRIVNVFTRGGSLTGNPLCVFEDGSAVSDAAMQALARPDAFSRLKSEDGHGMACVFADGGDARGTVVMRFFFPSGPAILEDPATGSACANLGGWFCALRPGDDVARTVSQGDEVHRPSSLFLAVRSGNVSVGGDVIELARGTLRLRE